MSEKLKAVKALLNRNPRAGWVTASRECGLSQGEARRLIERARTEIELEPAGSEFIDTPPKILMEENYLRLADDVTAAEISCFVISFIQFERRSPWYWGDLFAELKRLYMLRKPDAKIYNRTKDEFAIPLLANQAHLPKRIDEYIYVSETCWLTSRFETLSWSHHREAVFGSTEERSVVEWLKLAKQNSWTTLELREAIVIFKSGKTPSTYDGPEIWSKGYSEVGRNVNRICTLVRQEIKIMKPQDRNKLRELLEPIFKIYNEWPPR